MMMLALIAHQTHFNPSSNGKQNATTRPKTLIVCPLSLLHQWKIEIQERFRKDTLRVHIYYGDERGTSAATTGAINASDVVLTTYGVLSKEFERQQTTASNRSSNMTALYAIQWQRVILDEAHSIKNRATTYFKATAGLTAKHRWCLTGTPIQNSLDDLFSLLCFLQYEPWSRVAWWKRVIASPYDSGDTANALGRLKVILMPILLRRTKNSRDRNGNSIVNLPPKHMERVSLEFSEQERVFYQALYDKSLAEFNGFVATGTTMSSYIAIFALLLRLRQACDHPLLALGRNFEQVSTANGADADRSGAASLFQAQPNESMDAYYGRISAQLKQDLQPAASVSEVPVAQSPKLRIGAASSPGGGGGLTQTYIDHVLAQVEGGLDSQECPICLDTPDNGVLTMCAHVFCERCLRESLSNDPENGCPVCRTTVDISKVFSLRVPESAKESESSKSPSKNGGCSEPTVEPDSSSAASDGNSRVAFQSAKLKQLLHDLKAIRADDQARLASDPGAQKRKVIVFSQWTTMLEMIVELLANHGFAASMFHGALRQDAREQVLTQFAKDPAADVLVISLKAGGVGLNLTCASVVILMDPWWNPGVEDQAIDRVHRLGQTQDVLVKRYVVKDTVEDMIQTLQQRKEALAKHVLVKGQDSDDKRSERLTLDDLKSFFH